jgi:peptidoglycan/xylan/chitin deacetylase (PgdA/CDA1 family)
MCRNLVRSVVTRFSGGFVLAFHDIAPQRLAELVECLRPAQLVPLSEVVERCKARKSTSGLFAITIDDGVGENVKALAQLFLARQWPATFYLPTHYVDTGTGMLFQWWQRLKPFLPSRKLQLRSLTIDFSRPGAVEQFSKKMEQLWYTQRIDTYYSITMDLVDLVVREGVVERAALQPPAPISWPEVSQLSRSDLLSFESHGVSHAAMSSLTERELVFEMHHSRSVVEHHTGRPCRHLAYPFGGPESIGSLARVTAERYYDSATTMTLGHVDRANPWLLPRIPLYPKNSRLFAWLKILLKCNALIAPRPDRLSHGPKEAPAGIPDGSPTGAFLRTD